VKRLALINTEMQLDFLHRRNLGGRSRLCASTEQSAQGAAIISTGEIITSTDEIITIPPFASLSTFEPAFSF